MNKKKLRRHPIVLSRTATHQVICHYMYGIKMVTYNIDTNEMLKCIGVMAITYSDILKSKKCNHICPFNRV